MYLFEIFLLFLCDDVENSYGSGDDFRQNLIETVI